LRGKREEQFPRKRVQKVKIERTKSSAGNECSRVPILKYAPRGKRPTRISVSAKLGKLESRRMQRRTYSCIDPLPNHSILVVSACCRVGVSRCRGRRVRAVRRSIVDSCAHVRPSRANACRCRQRAAFSCAGISIAIPADLFEASRGRTREPAGIRWNLDPNRHRGAGTCDSRHVRQGETIDATGRAAQRLRLDWCRLAAPDRSILPEERFKDA